jgi:RimJ/RimL family protein N-acetyltransferase
MTSSIVENEASRRAAISAGYRECGRWRRHLYRDGRWHDMWLGEVLRDEWLASRHDS